MPPVFLGHALMLRRSSIRRKPQNSKARNPSRRRSNRLCGFESLEERIALSATPFGAQPEDTAEFLIGDVNVTVVLLESSDDPNDFSFLNDNSETWNQSSINAVKAKVTEGLDWWVDTLAGVTDKHQLNFNIDFTHADTPVTTTYEPITRPSTDYQFWIYDFLDSQVQNQTGSFTTDVKTFNHQQREANNTNWAFTIFVVNDENDANHKFAAGGLDRAFAFPGGLFLVTLASRPASTIAHETGHLFWAVDEYQGGGVYGTTRGYYNTQNVNAWNNPAPGYVRVPSILDRGSCDEGGGLLCDAYQQNTSSPSSLEMLGWRDSDGDGIFDVLDVDHSLAGSGSYDPTTGTYRFVGESSVQTLPNLNPRVSSLATESLQSDITINRISRVEYQIDGQGWQTAATPDTYVAAIDVTFAVPSSANEVRIRTIDATTGVTSPVFVGDLTRPVSVSQSGISGFVFGDTNSDGNIETGETGIAGRTVQLVDSSGQPIVLQQGVEPDDYAANAVVGNVNPDASLIAIGTATSTSTVYARSVGQGSTGTQAFSACSFTGSGGACSIYQTEWTSRTRQLRIDFDSPVTSVSIDALSNNVADFGRLAIYDANDNLLARYTTDSLSSGQVETMTLGRPDADIAYAIAGGHADTGVRLDNLRFGPTTSAVTDAAGAFSIPYLKPGTYNVKVEGLAGSQATTPTTQMVSISSNSPTATVDFGFMAFVSPWQNQTNRFDVNNDGAVSPVDALQVINDLNARGSRALTVTDGTPPFLDVNGDGHVAPIDALQVINSIEAALGEGESDVLGRPNVIFAAASSAVAEGEFVRKLASNTETGAATHSLLTKARASEIAVNAAHSIAAPSDAAANQRERPSIELDELEELLDSSTLSAAIDAFVDDVAVIWGTSRATA